MKTYKGQHQIQCDSHISSLQRKSKPSIIVLDKNINGIHMLRTLFLTVQFLTPIPRIKEFRKVPSPFWGLGVNFLWKCKHATNKQTKRSEEYHCHNSPGFDHYQNRTGFDRKGLALGIYFIERSADSGHWRGLDSLWSLYMIDSMLAFWIWYV